MLSLRPILPTPMTYVVEDEDTERSYPATPAGLAAARDAFDRAPVAVTGMRRLLMRDQFGRPFRIMAEEFVEVVD